MATKSAIIARIALRLTTVPGMTAVYAPAADGAVTALPDELTSWPCAVLLPGDSPVIPGNWERQTWTINGSVWVRSTPLGERARELTDISDDVLAAFRQPNAAAIDAAVQSVVLLQFGALTGRQWTQGEGAPTFLVLPFTLEAKVNRPVTYGPA